MASVEFLDSAACGNRKRGIEEITESCGDSSTAKAKAKAWASRQVLEFKDTYGIFKPFDEEMIYEREDFDPLVDYFDTDDEEVEEMKDAPYERHAVLRYISQVRDSFGFDVDVDLPLWLSYLRYFIPTDLSNPYDRPFAYQAANFAIDQINADMNSKTFELVEVVKDVTTVCCYSLEFLTLTAKKVGGEADEAAVISTIQAIVFDPINGPMELHQWRFKPDAPPPAEEA